MSKGRLLHPDGMNLEVLASHEFEGMNRYWYRVELYLKEDAFEHDDGRLTSGVIYTESAAYRRERGTWIPFAGNQQTAMEIHRLKMERLELESKIKEYERIEISYAEQSRRK